MIGDPRFFHAVIFMVAHDAAGAMGLVINSPMPDLDFDKLITEIGLHRPDKGLDALPPILSGGPVEATHGFLLHTTDYARPETRPVNNQFAVSATLESLQDMINGEGPRESLFILGYAGWDAGQLDKELAQNAWLLADADYDLVFNTPADDCWERAYGRLGVDPLQLSAMAGSA